MFKHHICVLAVGIVLIGACGGSSDAGDSSAADDAADSNAIDEADIEAGIEEAVDEAGIEADIEETATEIADDLADAPDAENAQESAEEFVDDIVDDLEAVQESQGGGGATLIANGQTWEFERVLCAFGEEQIGLEGAVFNLSAIADGLQLYASIDDSGETHTLSLNDIENFESPSVALSASPFSVAASGEPKDFLTLVDKSVTGEVVMIDDTTGEPIAEPAQLSATCP